MQSFIALGGNLGDVESAFRSALDELNADARVDVGRVSSFYRTIPMGEDAGGAYLNAAAELETTCPPLAVLDILQAIETRLGRDRQRPTRWGPRTLDLDLLLYGNEVFEHPRLTLPHPGCWYRRFVLDPLAEIAPDIVHPLKRETISELRRRLLQRPLPVSVAGGRLTDREQFAAAFSEEFSELAATPWSPGQAESPVLLFWLGTPTDQDLRFEDLPLLPRLDLTGFPQDASTAARHVLTAAIGS